MISMRWEKRRVPPHPLLALAAEAAFQRLIFHPTLDTTKRKMILSLPFECWLLLNWAQPRFQKMSNQRLDATVLGSKALWVIAPAAFLSTSIVPARRKGLGVGEGGTPDEQRA